MADVRSSRALRRLAWGLVVATVAVIAWGAWVRISHSGDGCGKSWPLCDGALFPKTGAKKTWIEFLHRLTSGLYGLGVIGLFVWVRRRFPAGTPQRQAATVFLALMLVEAGLGAALVLKGLVGENATVYRLVVMSFHQINSLLLTGIATATAVLIGRPTVTAFTWRDCFTHRGFVVVFIALATTGAWAALSNSLFPSTDLTSGLAEDFAAEAPWLLRLRILHPFLAIAIATGFAIYFWRRPHGQTVAVGIVLTAAIGLTTLLSLSPVALKLLHLVMVQGLWIVTIHYLVQISLAGTRLR